MNCYIDAEITIRTMNNADPAIFTECEIAQGWQATTEKLDKRLDEMTDGKCVVLVAEYYGTPAGYVSVYPNSTNGAFGGKGYTEIVDFNVLEKYRNKGIGTKLMDIAEKIALESSNTVYLGVGLMSSYGSAQRMYVKRGYIPDGSGVWYGNEVCQPYSDCKNDDDLVLYLSKNI